MQSKTIILFYLTFFSLNLLAQKNNSKFFPKNKIVFDTLVVYDTLFITDTVKIMKNRSPISAVEQLPLSNILLQIENGENKKILILNEDFAATFSKERILVVDKNNHSFTNQKSTTMKKIGFFGVLFFAFQNMVAAQNNISVGLGSGFYQIATTLSSPNPAYGGSVNKTAPSVLYKLGINGEKALIKGKFSVIASLNYAFQTKTIYSPTPIIGGYYYKDEYKKNFHSLSIPIAFRLNSPWIKPLIGIESYYRKTPVEYTIVTDQTTGKSTREGSIIAYFGAGLLAGCDIPLSNRLNIRLTYCKGLTKEYGGQYGSSDKLNSRLNKTEIALFYSFSKRAKQLTQDEPIK